ncbi:MAG TPA: hypothetical protein VNJ02_14450 [Vicinamibacterales bacterium]|nr:hypothetical protein [Vicinamibacterales bacterium]
MTLDVRIPAALLFLLLGAVLCGYGVLGDPVQTQRAGGVDINVSWGAALMVFGAALLVWRRGRPLREKQAVELHP